MPAIVRKLLIYAGAHGLLLQPVNHRNAPSSTAPISISYDDSAITSDSGNHDSDTASAPLEAHGIIGLLDLTINTYLVAISGRELVAHVRRKPIYLITEVSIIPLTSRQEAQRAISKSIAKRAKADPVASDDSDSSDDESAPGSIGDDDASLGLPVESGVLGAAGAQAPPGLVTKSTSFVSDVIKDRGRYGRFADKWFSTAGWTSNGRSRQGMRSNANDADNILREQHRQGLQVPNNDENLFSPSRAGVEMVDMTADGRKSVSQSGDDEKSARAVQDVMRSLVPRILSTTKLFFASRSFYFAYDYDLTRSHASQRADLTTTPLCKDTDPSFAWNRHLVAPLANAGQYSFVLPIVQGFVGQKAFTVASIPAAVNTSTSLDAEVVDEAGERVSKDSQPPPTTRDFLLTIISRRSANRAGLRYLRRGVDDQGNVANYVETEQILSSPDWSADETPCHSLMQLRGSIPLFFSQSPYSFKPIPITYGSEETNKLAFDRHFSMLRNRFGRVAVNSLVDKHATEARIGDLYQHHVQLANQPALNGNQLDFEWFDFHHACRGMKFENVSQLMDTLMPLIDEFGWSEQQGPDGTLPLRQQQGVMRTNCMDCLDRTNVVQCAIAGLVLQKQLINLGFAIDLKADVKTQWFNGLWADNGDAISRQYAGTAALKGDYTRTRKRAWTGALSDFSLTLHRFYNNMLGDYFLQTCIDYFQGLNDKHPGNPALMFVDFETDMMTSDHAMDMTRLRQSAIDTCVKIVLEDPDKEDLVWAWTLAAPKTSTDLQASVQGSLEECVFLLTDTAIYKVQFDWTTEKPGRFERVDLLQITGLQRGVYITNTFGAAHLDEARNRGFLIRYSPLASDNSKADGLEVRTNTRSMGNEHAPTQDSVSEPAAIAETPDAATQHRVSGVNDEQTLAESTVSRPDGDAPAEQNKDQCTLAFKALAASSSSASRSQSPASSRPVSTSIALDASRRSSAVGLANEETKANMSELESVHFITEEIKRLAMNARRKARQGATSGEHSGGDGPELDILDKDVVSVAQAKSRTSYLESLGYSIKKLVWS